MIVLIIFAALQVLIVGTKYWDSFYGGTTTISDKTFGLIEMISGVGFAVWLFAWLPFRRHETEAKKHQAQIKAKDLEIAALAKLLNTSLDVDCPPVKLKTNGSHNACMVRITNTGSGKSYANVEVELAEVEASADNPPETSLPLPVKLLPEKEKESVTIHPGASSLFAWPGIWVNATVIDDLPCHIVSLYFIELNKQRKLLTFETNRNYRIKLRITANDTPAVIPELNLNVTDDKTGCFFTLTKAQT